MTHSAEILTSSIIAIGDFNPAIFSPDWLERNNLIGEGDAKTAREGSEGRPLLVSHQATTYESEWFALQVLENQFSLTTKGVMSLAFKDLAVGIFQLVPHTPVKAVGLNFMAHFKCASEKMFHKVGDVLAPKDIWNTLYPDLATGMEQVTIRFQLGTRDKLVDTNDRKNITVQPSRSVKYGVSLALNDHHDVIMGSDDDLAPAERVAVIVDRQWESAWKDAVRVFDQLLSMAWAK